jgi:hypothetical protein
MPASVDTLFLLALGAGDSVTQEANRVLQNEGYDVFCTNTPLVELGAAELEDPDLKIAARKALEGRLTKWRIRDAVLQGVNNGIAENIAQDLERIFPDLEYHSALVIAEAAVVDSMDLLITWDPHLLNLDAGRLALFMKDRGHQSIAIVSPEQVISVLKKKRK